MAILVTGGGTAAFLSSAAMLRLGLTAMWIMYPLAVAMGYGVFLLLLWAWLSRYQQKAQRAESSGTSLDLPDLGGSGRSFGGRSGEAPIPFGGGRSGGGGAGGSFDAPAPAVLPQAVPPLEGQVEGIVQAWGDSPSLLKDLGLDVPDLDEATVVVVALVITAAVVVCVFASLYVVFIGPHLLAEILFDGALVTGLYRRFGKLERGTGCPMRSSTPASPFFSPPWPSPVRVT